MSTLKHQDYEGTVECDLERGVLHGKILFINSLVTYEAETLAQLKEAFAAAVEDYLDTCRELGLAAEKPLKGQFNVRISPALHKAAVVRSVADQVSLNMVMVRALEGYLLMAPPERVSVTVNLHQTPDSVRSMATSSSAKPSWINLGGSDARH